MSGVTTTSSKRSHRGKRQPYYNAKTILPPELFAQVQQYCSGAMLYVPSIFPEKQRNRLKVLALVNQGFRQVDIARLLHMSRTQVYRIRKRQERDVSQWLGNLCGASTNKM